jgi:hypothetical protein
MPMLLEKPIISSHLVHSHHILLTNTDESTTGEFESCPIPSQSIHFFSSIAKKGSMTPDGVKGIILISKYMRNLFSITGEI